MIVPSERPKMDVVYRAATGPLRDGSQGETPVSLLGRCRWCRKGYRVAGAVRGSVTSDTAGAVQCFRWAQVYQLPSGVRGLAYRGSWWEGMRVYCEGCAAEGRKNVDGSPVVVLLRLVIGKFNAEKKCDGRCQGATGPLCECRCAGANHGAAHDQA